MHVNENDKKARILCLILCVVPLQQLAIDQYLPSLPPITESFNTTEALVKLSLTIYILSLGFVQFIYGPMAEKFGRRPTLLIGLGIFLLGTLLSSVAGSISAFLISRFIQGLGIGCGFVCVTAILGDTFEGSTLARYSSYTSCIYSLSPLIAPVLGGILQTYYGWRSNFIFVSIYAGLLFTTIYCLLPETLATKKPNAFDVKTMATIYYKLIQYKPYLGFVLCQLFAFTMMIIFNLVGPFLCQNILGLSPLIYGELLLILGAAYLIASYLNSRCVARHSKQQLLYFGFSTMLFFTLALILATALGYFSIYTVMISTTGVIFGSGFIFPTAYAGAVECFPEHGGPSGALMGAAGLLGNAIISALLAPFAISTGYQLGELYLAVCILTFSSILLTRQEEKESACRQL